MRVLLTTDTIGGVWSFTRELSEGLLQAGHAVALISFGRAPSPDQTVWAEQATRSFNGRFSYTSSKAPLEWMQQNEDAWTAAAHELRTLAAWFRPDIFHSNQYCFGSFPLDIPKLITAHSDVLSWAAACRPQGLMRSAWLDQYRALVQSGLDGADAIAAPTKFMMDALTSHFQVSCSTSIIFNGRTLAPAARTALRSRQAVSTGRLWDEAKGLSTLLEMDSPVPVLIAGEEAFEEISRRTIASQVRRLGRLNEAKLLKLFRESSVYLVPSLYEPFGLAPLEAGLCGCAIVARNLPSLREVWGEAAVYFDTAEELSEKLHRLFASDDELRSRQSAALERAETFTVQRMTSSYLELYEDLVSGADLRATAPQERAPNAA